MSSGPQVSQHLAHRDAIPQLLNTAACDLVYFYFYFLASPAKKRGYFPALLSYGLVEETQVASTASRVYTVLPGQSSWG